MTATLPDASPASPLPTPAATRWRPLRAGLQDIWQYDHTTRFVFHHGRLLLRGRNGAGKTKVVEVLLPFLLEGKLNPSRLDPFGTRSRKMHYNILPPERDAASAIGYVWLEFGRRDADGHDRYVTIGAGLKARKSSDNVDSWFFVVHDRRIDVDLALLHDDRRPLGRPALAEAVGEDGTVIETSREYRAAVNRALFGTEPDQYDALVEALLRLRQPHLSERLDPDAVGDVLADSLPPLDATRVHEVAEGFERLEAHRRDLDDRRRTLGAVEQFLGEYRGYAATVAAVRARALTRADSAVRAAADRVTGAEEAHDRAVAASAELRERLTTAEGELDAIRMRIHTLETSDEYRAVQQLEEAETQLERDERLAEGAERRHQETAEAHRQATARTERAATDATARRAAVEQTERDAGVAAAAAELRGEHATVAGLVPTDPTADTTAANGALRSIHEERRRSIIAVQQAVAAVEQARAEETESTRRLQDTRAETGDREAELRAAEQDAQQAVDDHRERIDTWAYGTTELRLDDDELATLVDADPTDTLGVARGFAGGRRDRIDVEIAEADAAARGAAERLADAQAEHDALASATHQSPTAPPWRTAERTDRPGAPLYLLLELDDRLDATAGANIEAALHAAGLLDAWVTPDGTVLDSDTHDAVALPSDPAPGRSLADVARPAPDAGVNERVVTDILRSIGFVDRGASGDQGRHWVAPDGRFRLGPLAGAARGDAVRYLGETARRRERERRLTELAATIDQLRDDLADARRTAEQARDRRRQLDLELDALPAVAPVLEARAKVTAAAGHLEDSRERERAAADRVAEAEHRRVQAETARDATADEHRLGPYVDRLDELATATDAWRSAAREWLHAADRWLDAAGRLAELQAAAAATAERLAGADDDRTEAHRELARTREQVRTLREAVGATRDELLTALGEARHEQVRLDGLVGTLHDDRVTAAKELGAAETEQAAAAEAHDRVRHERESAAHGVQLLATLGVLQQLVDDIPTDDPATWSVRATLEVARQVGKLGPDVPDAPEAVEELLSATRNRLARRQQELLRDLVAGIRLFPTEHPGGVLVYEAQHQGRTYRLDGLVTELREDVAERDARLQGDERELLESFLAGELHEHLRSRIRDATDLVEAMNEQLARCRTAAGQQLRLRWRVDEDAPPATEQAIELLLRGSGLLTEDQRGQLRAYLHERLREAREGEAAVSLFERIAGAFDYRRWHRFTIEFRDASAGSWRRLTRQAHGTGSGGEKAVMLHLPLFAAMAAHYHSRPTAPRLIVLDEVFAGIDRGTRGQLMGLLVELDLDVLFTSHEEWGFYRELDGLSTYHLVREPDVPGVLAEWFVWDGANRWEMTDN